MLAGLETTVRAPWGARPSAIAHDARQRTRIAAKTSSGSANGVADVERRSDVSREDAFLELQKMASKQAINRPQQVTYSLRRAQIST